MNIIAELHKKLDSVFLPMGILSYHKRKVDVETVNDMSVDINNNEYIVFSIISALNKTYGDGVVYAKKYYIDINYYYNNENVPYNQAFNKFELFVKSLKNDAIFRVVSEISDLPDINTDYYGFTLEVAGVVIGNE